MAQRTYCERCYFIPHFLYPPQVGVMKGNSIINVVNHRPGSQAAVPVVGGNWDWQTTEATLSESRENCGSKSHVGNEILLRLDDWD